MGRFTWPSYTLQASATEMNELEAGAIGLVSLMTLAGLVQVWPRLGKIFIGIAVSLFAVSLILFVVRGDLFASSGVDAAETTDGCGWVMVC